MSGQGNMTLISFLLFGLCGSARDVHNNQAHAFSTLAQGTSRSRHSARGHATFRRRRAAILHATPDDDDFSENDTSGSQSEDAMSKKELNQQKRTLENMLRSSFGDGNETTTISSSAILTTSRKKRLEREIELLKQLDPDHPENNIEFLDVQNQEFVMSELWSLWYGERGPMEERRLRAIEETLVDPNLWPEAENEYMELIQEHCNETNSKDGLNLSNWVEPANRLATLLFMMGRFRESKRWCERILEAKPWHIGALSGVVMVCMKMGDKEGVLKFAKMGMPNLSTEMRGVRKAWVQKQVHLAEENLSRLKELNRKAFGEPDESSVNYVDERSDEDTDRTKSKTDEDTWQ